MEIGCERTYWAPMPFCERPRIGGQSWPHEFQYFLGTRRARVEWEPLHDCKRGEKLPHKTACQSADRPGASDKQYPKKLTELHKCEMKILGVHLPWDGDGRRDRSRSRSVGLSRAERDRRRNFDADGGTFCSSPPSILAERDGQTDDGVLGRARFGGWGRVLQNKGWPSFGNPTGDMKSWGITVIRL